MTGKIGRKKVLKFRDFPTRLHGEVFFVENGYDEKLNLSIITISWISTTCLSASLFILIISHFWVLISRRLLSTAILR